MITINTLAWKNIVHKLFRSIGIAVAVAAVVGTLFFVTSIMRSVEVSLTKNASRLGADLILVPRGHKKEFQQTLQDGTPAVFYMEESVVDELLAVTVRHPDFKDKLPVVKDVSRQLFLLTDSSGCCDIPGTLLIGFDPETDFTILPWRSSDSLSPLLEGEVLVGNDMPHRKGYNLQLFNKVFSVAGKLDATGSAYFDQAIFLNLFDLRELLKKSETLSADSGNKDHPDLVSALLVRISPIFNARRISRYIERYVPAAQVILSEEVQTSMGRQVFMLLRAILVASAILWIISFLIIAVIFSMIINERVWEMGILRAMGACRLVIFRLTITEASILSCLGGAIGIMIGGIALYLFKGIIEKSFSMPYQWAGSLEFVVLALLCMLIGLVTGIAAALAPALRSSMMEPATAIAKGE